MAEEIEQYFTIIEALFNDLSRQELCTNVVLVGRMINRLECAHDMTRNLLERIDNDHDHDSCRDLCQTSTKRGNRPLVDGLAVSEDVSCNQKESYL